MGAFEIIGLKAMLQGGSQYVADLKRAEAAEKALGDEAKVAAAKSEAMGKMLTKVSLGITAGLVGGIALAIKSATGFENALDQVGAVAEATEEEMQSLRKTALQLGADTAFSANDAAKAMHELAAGGRSVADIVGGEAAAAVALAAAGNYNLADSAKTIATAMDVWKGTQIETNDVVNRLAGAANSSRFGVEDMSAAIAQGGGVAAAVGVSFADFTTGITAVASSFASGSDAGTSFKTFLLSLDGSTEKSKKAIKEYGLEFRAASGELKPMAQIVQELHDKIGPLGEAQQVAALKTIFGNDAYRTAAGLMKMTAAEFDAMSNKMRDTKAADVAAQRMGNLSGNLEQLKGSIDTLAINIGSAFIPILTKASAVLTTTANAFGGLESSTQTFIVAGITVVAALPAMISLFGKLATAAKALATMKASAALGMTAFAAGLLVVGTAVDILLQKQTGGGLFDHIFGDMNRADQAKDAMKEWAIALEMAGPKADAAALAIEQLNLVTDNAAKTGMVEYGKGLDGMFQNLDRIAGKMTGTYDEGFNKAVKSTKELEEQTRLLATQMMAANVPLEAQWVLYQRLPPQLQEVFDGVTNVADRYEAYTANLASASDEQDRWGDALRVAQERLAAEEAALGPATTALDAYYNSLEKNEDGVADLTKELDILIGRFADFNPKVIALQAENALLTESIEDIKDSTDKLSPAQKKQIEDMEKIIESNDKVIKGYKDNQDAMEGVRNALTPLIGERGYGALLAVMEKLNVPQEDQIALAGRIAAAYKLLANDDIPGAIAAFGKMKDELSPEVWKPIGEAVGPALSVAIKEGMSGPDADAAVEAARQLGINIGDGVSLGLNSASNRISQTGRGIIRAAIDNMEQEAGAKSPSQVTMALGEDIGLGLVIGMANSEGSATEGGQMLIHGIVVGMEEEAPALTASTVDILDTLFGIVAPIVEAPAADLGVSAIAGIGTGMEGEAPALETKTVDILQTLFGLVAPIASESGTGIGSQFGVGLGDGIQRTLPPALLDGKKQITDFTDAVNTYLSWVAVSGDWQSDWLTHMPELFREAAMRSGKLFSEGAITIDDAFENIRHNFIHSQYVISDWVEWFSLAPAEALKAWNGLDDSLRAELGATEEVQLAFHESGLRMWEDYSGSTVDILTTLFGITAPAAIAEQAPFLNEATALLGVGAISSFYNAMLVEQEKGLAGVLQGFNLADAESDFHEQMITDFGEMGGEVAIAFGDAMVDQTPASGAKLLKAIKKLIAEAEKEGVAGAKEWGEKLMAAFAKAIATGEPALVAEALAMLDKFEAEVAIAAEEAGGTLAEQFAKGYQEERDSRDLEEEIGRDGASLMEALKESIEDGTPQTVGAMSKAANDIVDLINDTFEPGAAKSIVGLFMAALNEAIETGGEISLANLQAILGKIDTASATKAGTNGAASGSEIINAKGSTTHTNPVTGEKTQYGSVATYGLTDYDISQLGSALGLNPQQTKDLSPEQLSELVNAAGVNLSNYVSTGGMYKIGSILDDFPAFERGVMAVPEDMLAWLHRDEMVIPAEVAEILRNQTAMSENFESASAGSMLIPMRTGALVSAGSRTSNQCQGENTYIVDMRGVQMTGTPDENEDMIRRIIHDEFSNQTGRGALIHGVTRR